MIDRRLSYPHLGRDDVAYQLNLMKYRGAHYQRLFVFLARLGLKTPREYLPVGWQYRPINPLKGWKYGL